MILTFNLSLLFAVEIQSSAMPKKESYVMYITPYDFGPAVEKIELNLGHAVLFSSVKAEDFDVTVLSNFSDDFSPYRLVKGGRKVLNAYLSDGAGNPFPERRTGQFVTIVMQISPNDDLTSPFPSTKLIDSGETYGYKIENSKLGISISHRTALVCKEVVAFECKNFVFGEGGDEISMEYASFVPEKKNDNKIPLIVFFHGMGESGRNIYKPLLKIKSTALAEEKIQSYFKDGAAVLIPQCPTGWLEITEKDPFGNRLWAMVDINGTVNKVMSPVTSFLSKIFVSENSTQNNVVTPVSYYTVAVKELIDLFVKQNPQIDVDRIYLGGCSAGGFMTLNMMIQYPDFFAAGFPICEAFPNERINTKDLLKVSQKPMWFILAENDPTIDPEKYTKPTVQRLIDLGAENLHHTYFKSVKDLSGKFFDEDKKNPYEYHGHDSWIYVFNDQVSENGLSLFSWLCAQSNGK